MSRSRRRCKECGRAVRGAGIFLYETPDGRAELCGKRCLKAYNGEPSEPCDCAAHQAAPVQTSARRRRRVAA